MRKFLLFITCNVLCANFVVNARSAFETTSTGIVHATICYMSMDNKYQLTKDISLVIPNFNGTDPCAPTPTVLVDAVADLTGTTVGSIDEGIVPAPPGIIGAFGDVWYDYTVPVGNNRVLIDFNLNPNAVVTMYTNCAGANETILFNNIVPTEKCVAVTAGTTYKIRVSNINADKGPFEITLTASNLTLATIAVAETSGNLNNDGIICVGDDADLTASPAGVGFTYNWSVFPVQTTQSINVIPLSTTTYTVTVTDPIGCSSTATQIITVNPLPATTLTLTENSGNAPANNGNVCVGDAFTITITPGFTTYDWELDGFPLATVGNILNVPSAVLADDGLYSVTITDINGCTSIETQTINISPLPIANNTTLIACNNGSGQGSFTLPHAELSPDIFAPYNPSVNSNTVADVDNGFGGLTVTYHATLANAISGTGALTPVFLSRVQRFMQGC
ncbi:MAG: hypothetical protein IPO92_12630 [Saprospiraceae bacterium]|nr:hypothetical protein [Saprospiraceae bacterium]